MSATHMAPTPSRIYIADGAALVNNAARSWFKARSRSDIKSSLPSWSSKGGSKKRLALITQARTSIVGKSRARSGLPILISSSLWAGVGVRPKRGSNKIEVRT
jgi:hypothetical protein